MEATKSTTDRLFQVILVGDSNDIKPVQLPIDSQMFEDIRQWYKDVMFKKLLADTDKLVAERAVDAVEEEKDEKKDLSKLIASGKNYIPVKDYDNEKPILGGNLTKELNIKKEELDNLFAGGNPRLFSNI